MLADCNYTFGRRKFGKSLILIIGQVLSERVTAEVPSLRSMLRVWIFPLAILAYAFEATPRLTPWASMLARPETVQARLSFCLGWGCQPRAGCIDQSVITRPFYASVAHSLGALLARNAYRKAGQNESGTQEIALGPG
jgi:hypothetical protein